MKNDDLMACKPISFSLDEELIQKLKEFADDSGNRSKLVSKLLKEHFKNEK